MNRYHWDPTDPQKNHQALARPPQESDPKLQSRVQAILQQVKESGDSALRQLTQDIDGLVLDNILLEPNNPAPLNNAQKLAIDTAYETIRRFHKPQGLKSYSVETLPGVQCQRLARPLEKVGFYIPGGSAPLISTVLMLGIPAQLAGCPLRVLCTPPQKSGSLHPGILYAASRLGITTIAQVGGAQAIGALAYGTQSIPKVDKIFGPGNAWVTEAKRQVSMDSQGAAIDMPAGPSEVMVVADATGDPQLIAADLLSQAEHDPSSQVILVTDHPPLVELVNQALQTQTPTLSRQEIINQALRHGRAVSVSNTQEIWQVVNTYAPEHLILHVDNPASHLDSIRHAGSIFLGPHSPESVGDYASGTNHVLPTYGAARAYSGLGVEAFMKTITVQQLSPQGLANLAPTVINLADMEGLDGHRQAVTLRLPENP